MLRLDLLVYASVTPEQFRQVVLEGMAAEHSLLGNLEDGQVLDALRTFPGRSSMANGHSFIGEVTAR